MPVAEPCQGHLRRFLEEGRLRLLAAPSVKPADCCVLHPPKKMGYVNTDTYVISILEGQARVKKRAAHLSYREYH